MVEFIREGVPNCSKKIRRLFNGYVTTYGKRIKGHERMPICILYARDKTAVDTLIFSLFACGLFEKAVYSRRWSI